MIPVFPNTQSILLSAFQEIVEAANTEGSKSRAGSNPFEWECLGDFFGDVRSHELQLGKCAQLPKGGIDSTKHEAVIAWVIRPASALWNDVLNMPLVIQLPALLGVLFKQFYSVFLAHLLHIVSKLLPHDQISLSVSSSPQSMHWILPERLFREYHI